MSWTAQTFFYKKKPGGGGSFRGSKNQKSGNVINCPEKLFKKNPGGGGSFKGHIFKVREISWTAEKIDTFFCNPRMERGGGGRERGDMEGEREREAGREGGARAKPGNQLVLYNNCWNKITATTYLILKRKRSASMRRYVFTRSTLSVSAF